MATRRPLVAVNGAPAELPLGDVVAGVPAAAGGFCDVSMGTANGSTNAQTLGAGVFTVVNLDTIVSDDETLFNTTTRIYTVAKTAVHVIAARLRPVDNTANGAAFGFGVHSASTDGPHFQWGVTAYGTGGRASYSYSRQARFTAGDQLRLYVFTSATVNINNAGMTITRLG